MTDHAVVAVDSSGTITHWSAGAEALFGYGRESAVGRTLDLIVPEPLRDRHWAGFRQAMLAPQIKDLAADIPVLCADAEIRTFPGRLLVLSDGLGQALGALGIFSAEGSTGIRPFS